MSKVQRAGCEVRLCGCFAALGSSQTLVEHSCHDSGVQSTAAKILLNFSHLLLTQERTVRIVINQPFPLLSLSWIRDVVKLGS